MFRSQLATLTLGTSVVDAALTQGYSTHTIQHDGAEREFKVYLPSNSIYTGLFLMHHGWTEDMDSACTYGEIQKYAEEYGFVGVCPQGLRYGNGETGWNVGTCCAGADTAGTDDLGFIRKVVEFVNAEVSIPAGRTYAGGFSNGCALSFRLACELSDVIFGVGCAGAAYDHAYTGRGVLSCNPANPRPYWSQIGSFDSFYSVTDSKAGWRRYATEVLRCGSATEVVYNQDSVTCEEHTSCPVAKSSRFCEMSGLWHVYQSSSLSPWGKSPTEAAWLYLSESSDDSTSTSRSEDSTSTSDDPQTSGSPADPASQCKEMSLCSLATLLVLVLLHWAT
mmetsp:Transcript_34024/g.79285  ORF Transcript_34024/g.79285 Transcript_34024/m.79285 type:complete len:335 (+) Transcript_34024:50-1054(+)